MINSLINNRTFESISDVEIAMDNSWLVLTAVLILFMQAGFTMLEAGSVSSDSTVNILFKNLADTCISAIAFWLVGYGFAYGDASNGFIGTTHFALIDNNFDSGNYDGANQYAFYFQKWAFAATSATIVSGSLAERCKLDAYFVYTFFVTAFIYPVVVCWCWGGGWLSPFTEDSSHFLFYGSRSNNYIDFAGSGVVHLVGGVGGLVGAILIRPRKGRFNEDGTVCELPKHSLVIFALGVFLLWIGWYGFNAGSTECASIQCAELSAKIAVITTISAGAGGLTAIFGQRILGAKSDLVMVVNGIIAGLVSITGGCAVVEPWAACVVGVIGFLVYCVSSHALLKLHIDDPLDAAPLHGACGIWGILVPGIFGTDANASIVGYRGSSAGYGPIASGEQFGVQLVGALVITAWAAITSFLLFSCIKATIGLRPHDGDFEGGLDDTTHGQRAYNMEIHTFSSKSGRSVRSKSNASQHAYHPLGMYVDIQKLDSAMKHNEDDDDDISEDLEIHATSPVNGTCEEVD
jgi:Amt family ammonium transporter